MLFAISFELFLGSSRPRLRLSFARLVLQTDFLLPSSLLQNQPSRRSIHYLLPPTPPRPSNGNQNDRDVRRPLSPRSFRSCSSSSLTFFSPLDSSGTWQPSSHPIFSAAQSTLPSPKLSPSPQASQLNSSTALSNARSCSTFSGDSFQRRLMIM